MTGLLRAVLFLCIISEAVRRWRQPTAHAAIELINRVGQNRIYIYIYICILYMYIVYGRLLGDFLAMKHIYIVYMELANPNK